MKCYFHPHRDALTRCRQCHRPICSHCRMSTPDGIFCSDECYQNFVQFTERLESLEEAEPRSDGWKGALRKIGMAILLICVFWAYVFDIGGFRQKVHKVGRYVGSAFVDVGHKVRDTFRSGREAKREGRPLIAPEY